MLRASKYSRKEKHHSTKIALTRQQKDIAKTEGDIRGWFGIVAKVPKGRPKKLATGADASIITAAATTSTNHDTMKRSGAAANSISGQPEPKRIRGDKGGKYIKWNSSDEHFAVLKAAVINTIKPDALMMVDCRVSRATAGRYIRRFNAAAKRNDVAVQEVTRDMIFGDTEATRLSSLLSESDWKFISDIAISRDMRNNGMTRAEMITMIVELSQGASFKQAKNHYEYLVRTGHLKGLKRGGRVVTCQKTTTKRSQITMEQQLRWHTSVDFALSEQVRLNLPADEFERVKEHFFCRMDESCLLGSDGTVKVIGSASKSKTEKIMGDCRSSITVLRTGAAGGSSGPWIFLAAGKELTCRALKNIDKKDGVPPNSKVYMTPTAYMTDNVYAIIAPELADGIRKMPYICDHPNWWVVVSLDGFGSHVNVHEAQEAFYKRKILILKEEGDTLHINQAYDQSVAKNDKAGMRANLDMLRPHIGTKLDQWYLITIAIDALKRVKATA
jgi:hypothetical protein